MAGSVLFHRVYAGAYLLQNVRLGKVRLLALAAQDMPVACIIIVALRPVHKGMG